MSSHLKCKVASHNCSTCGYKHKYCICVEEEEESACLIEQHKRGHSKRIMPSERAYVRNKIDNMPKKAMTVKDGDVVINANIVKDKVRETFGNTPAVNKTINSVERAVKKVVSNY